MTRYCELIARCGWQVVRETGGYASKDQPRPGSSRLLWVLAHRWAGLTIALFLVIAGMTGAVLPFEEPLTFATRPDRAYVAPPAPGAAPLDGVTIAERVERQTGAAVAFIPLEIPRDHVVRLFVTAKTGRAPLPYDMVWADPYSGAVRLTYRWGGLHDGIVNLVPFLYSLHYGRILGDWGMWVFGLAALIWTVDCFVGFYLTLPVWRRTAAGPGWWSHWRPAWRVRRSSGYKLTFDLHRAGGLWLWPLLLVFAWSGVGLTLPSVEQPVMRLFGAAPQFVAAPLPQPIANPPIDRRRAVELGQGELAALGRRQGFSAEQPTGLSYDPASGLYRYMARTSLDRIDAGGFTTLWIDGRSGRAVRFDPPLGRTGADMTMGWLYMLHMAEVFGLPYRIFVSILGLAVTGLTVTGVLIWMKKRSARLLAARRRPRRAPQSFVPMPAE